jgi:hypothetical protein
MRAMGMVMALATISDANIERVIADPPLVWQIVAADEPELYEQARSETAERPGLFARLLGKKPNNVPDLVLSEHEGGDTDLDKAWHGIHYLLTRTAWEGSAPQNFLLVGGRTAGDLEVGYGPVRLYTAAEVKSIHQHLASVSDAQLRSRFNPQEMMKLEIYPEIWDRPPDQDDTLGYLMESLDTLRAFIETATRRSMGIAISLM